LSSKNVRTLSSMCTPVSYQPCLVERGERRKN
jgi:hypothetical protein